MKDSVIQTLKRGPWPSWTSCRRARSVPLHQVCFTIRLAAFLKREKEEMGLEGSPERIIPMVQSKTKVDDQMSNADLWEQIQNEMVRSIYGSNYIESAGSSYDLTIQLCRKVFEGIKVEAEISDRDPEYQAHVEALVASKRQANQSEVVGSRREIIQHAKAFSFLMDRIVLDSLQWSTDLILDTHRILYEGLEHTRDDVVPGQYREHECAAYWKDPKEPSAKPMRSLFLRPNHISRYMEDMADDLNQEIADAERNKELDPYTMAAKYHHRFIAIHPFGDGNGRMSRIILNVLLLKYAGHITAFGCDDEEKNEYIGVAARAARKFHEEDLEVEKGEEIGHFETAKFVLRQSKRGLECLKQWLSKKDGPAE